MNSKLKQYIIESLAHTGFVIADPGVALIMRQDIWASPANAASDFSDPKLEAFLSERGLLFTATLDGGKKLHGATRSIHMLAERIEWIVGHVVTSIDLVDSLATPQSPQKTVMADDGGATLRALAAKEPPSWNCRERQEILAARQKLGLVGEAAE